MSNAVGVRITKDGIGLVGLKASEKPLELRAGERLGTVLERKRDELDLDVDDLVADLPIREYAYRRIEAGLNVRPPETIFLRLFLKLWVWTPEELGGLADLDSSDLRRPLLVLLLLIFMMSRLQLFSIEFDLKAGSPDKDKYPFVAIVTQGGRVSR